MMLVIAIFAEIALFVDPLGSVNFIYPENPGEDLIDYPLGVKSILSLLILIIIIISSIFSVFAMLYKGFQSEGILKKKFHLVGLGAIIATVSAIPDSFLGNLGIFFFVTRTGTVIACWIFYLAFRETPEKRDEIKITKEIKVKGDLFRISKYRREDITEEEVTISKEKKICLICKGKVGRFSFICNECGTFYCEKCANSLINLENTCWACNTPIDPLKPSKPYKSEKEEPKLKISEDIQKDPGG